MREPSDIGALPRLRVLLVSIGVCVFVGVPVGTFAMLFPQGTPFLVYVNGFVWTLAFVVGTPVALVAGTIGGFVLLLLLQSKRWHPGWQAWTLGCMALGILMAAPLGVAVGYAGSHDERTVLNLIGVLSVPSGCCGAILGFYGWHEARRREPLKDLLVGT